MSSISNKKTTVTKEDLDELLTIFRQFNVDNVWSMVDSEQDFQTKRFKFGYVNNIIHCELTQQAQERLLAKPNKCRRRNKIDFPSIVVKFLAKEFWLEIDHSELALVNTILSQRGISPKLLFINDKCHVNQYIEGRNYNYDDDCCEKTVRQLGGLLAQLHSISPMPISCKGYQKWLELNCNPSENEMAKPFLEKVHLKHLENNKEFYEKYYESIAELDLVESYDFFEKLVGQLNSPLVFSHNDFNRGNRLVAFDKDGQKRIYLVDLDYSNYNHRGADLGRYFSNYRHKDDMFGNEGFPLDQQMDVFLSSYRQEFAKQLQMADGTCPTSWLEDPVNSLQHLRDEAKVFAMRSYLDDCWFAITMFVEQPELENFLIIAKTRYEGFKQLKLMFTEDGTLKRIQNYNSSPNNTS